MATYNFNSTGSTEYLPVNLSASEEITFHVTNSNEGSSYFTIETYPDNNGAYSSTAPKNASGSYVSSSGITTIVSDDYHMSAVVENGGGTITFAPADFISGSDLKVRGVGARTDYASTIDRWPNAAAAYSLRRLNSNYNGPAVKVRRSVDNEEKDINFIGTSLDTTNLTTFTVPTSPVLPSNYGSGSTAAYSLRYVSSTYTGPVVKVRRASDNAEADISADSQGNLNTEALETFVNRGNVLLDPDITSATGWTLNTKTTFNASTEAFDLVDENALTVRQAKAIANRTYTITIVIDSITSGGIKIYAGGAQSAVISTAGTHVLNITAGTSNTILAVNPSGAVTCSISSFYAVDTTSDGFVITWYDQSGNGRNAIQSTSTYQPQIVSSGTVIKENGIPTTQYDGINDYLRINNSSTTGSNPIDISGSSVSVFIVLTPTDNNSAYIFGNYQGSGVYNGNHVLFHQDPSGSGITFKNSYDDNVNPIQELSSPYSVNNTYLWTNILRLGSTSFMYINNSLETSTSDTTDGNFTSDQDWVIGARSISPSSEVWGGKMSEIILHKSDQSSNLPDIESNINNYYNIFDYNAYVTTWYDQSGNENHATQGTAASQPVIVSGSQIYTLQGQPALHTFSSSLDLTSTSSFEDLTWYVVSKKRGLGSLGSIMFAGGSSSTYGGENIDGRGIPVMYAGGRKISTLDNNASPSEFSLIPHITFYNTSASTAVGGVNLEVNPSADVSSISFPLSGLFQYIDQYPQYRYDGLTSEIILYSQSLEDNRFNLQSSINSHYKIYWDGALPRLLNTYAGSAAAYSLRALNQEYTGSLIRVRRASNNEEINIGADYEGNLDTNLLEQFCSGTDGFVTTWYDQSGNGYNATTTVASRQPQIVSSGTVITENGKPVVKFDGSDDQLVSVFGTTYAQPTYFFLTHNFHSTPTAFDAAVGSISVENRLILNASLNYNIQAGGAFGYNSYSPSQSLASYKIQQSDPKFFFNGVQQSVTGGTNIGSSGLEGIILGGIESGSSTGTSPIQIQEFIAYGSDQDLNRTNIESNINSYYNIY